ncbi:MAG: BlaI/MecI/CopY family transcriptional regulator [Bacteroidota bacterium]
MIQLTKAEEQVMMILWRLEKAYVKEILSEFPDPKPAYNTVSTIIRILENKEVVGHESFGRSHQYFPKVTMEEYRSKSLQKLVSGYFGGSLKQLVSSWMGQSDLNVQDLEELIKEAKNQKDD